MINEAEARGLGFRRRGGGGGSGGGRIRRDSYGGMSVVARRKSLRCGRGSGIRRGERWQLGLLEQNSIRRRGCERRTSEWWLDVIGVV